ncbi:MAG TPA: phosphatase PAP2 family protein [Sphingobacteriaceae bacterium]
MTSSEKANKLIIWVLLIITSLTVIMIIWPPFYHALHTYDIQALKAINSNRIRTLDPIFLFITNTSSLVCIIIIAFTLLAGWVKRAKNLILKGSQLLVTFLTSFIIIKALKYLIGRNRPYITYDFLDKLAQAESLSFPSGHTFEAFAFSTAVALLFKNLWIRIFIFTWAVLVGLSRMILGMHYISDVIGGIIFGLLTGYFVHILYKQNTISANRM